MSGHCGKRLPPRITIPHESQKGKYKSRQNYTHRSMGRFIGSRAPSQLVTHNRFILLLAGLQGQLTLNWTQTTGRLSVILYIACNVAWEHIKGWFLVLDTYRRLFNKTTYCTKLLLLGDLSRLKSSSSLRQGFWTFDTSSSFWSHCKLS